MILFSHKKIEFLTTIFKNFGLRPYKPSVAVAVETFGYGRRNLAFGRPLLLTCCTLWYQVILQDGINLQVGTVFKN